VLTNASRGTPSGMGVTMVLHDDLAPTPPPGSSGFAGHFVDVERCHAGLTGGEQPRARSDDRRVQSVQRPKLLPTLARAANELPWPCEAIKPGRRRATIDKPERHGRCAALMLARIQENVAQRPTHGARRCQRAGVVAIGKYLAPTPQPPIDRPGHAHRQTLHTARQCSTVLCFGHQVQMVALYAEVHQPKAKTIAPGRQRSPHRQEQLVLAKGPQPCPHAQRDVQRMTPRMRRPSQMRYARPCPLRLSTCSRTRAAPRAKLKCALTHHFPRLPFI